MPYILTCECGQQMNVTEGQIGKSSQCAGCGCRIDIAANRFSRPEIQLIAPNQKDPLPPSGVTQPSPGVIAIGVISIVLAVIGLVLLLLSSMLDSVGDPVLEHYSLPNYESAFYHPRWLVDCVLPISLLVSGIGTFMLKPWARTLAFVHAWCILAKNGFILVVIFATVFPTVFRATAAMDSGLAAGMVGALIVEKLGGCIYPIVLVVFFSRKSVKKQFITLTGSPS